HLPDWVPIHAAPCDRPMRRRPTFGVKDARPSRQLIAAEFTPFDQLALNILRQRLPQKSAHLLTECQFIVGKTKIHRNSSGRCARLLLLLHRVAAEVGLALLTERNATLLRFVGVVVKA